MKPAFRPTSLALTVFLLGVVVAWLERDRQAADQQAVREERFGQLAERVANQLKTRVQSYEYGLRGARGAVISAGEHGISRERFHAYSQSRELEREFPGSRGFGFVRRVPEGQEAAFLRQARADGKPDFKITYLAPHAGERLVIQYLEPESNNRQAIGLDIASEPNRLAAAQSAMRTGRPTLTGPITLVQASGKVKRGFLFLIPTYRSDMPVATPDQRWRAAYGLAYTPMVIDEVLADFDLQKGRFSMALEDVGDTAGPDRFYVSPGVDAPVLHGLASKIPVSLYGREWLVEVKALPGFLADLNFTDPNKIALGIVAVALLLAVLAQVYLTNRERRRQSHLDQARLAAIVEGSNDAIVGKALDGVITSWNKAAERIFGYPADQALGRKVADLLVPADLRDEEEDILRRVRNDETVPHFNTLRRRRDGSLIDVSVTVSPVHDQKGRVIGAAKTVRDITEQKRGEARFHLAVEAAPTAMLMVDASQVITLANHKANELFGYSEEELLGMNLETLIPVRFRQAHAGHVGQFHGEPSMRAMGLGRELFGLRKDGGEVPVEIGLNPVETPEGMLTLASITDITVRRQLEQKLHSTVERMRLAVDAAGIGVWQWQLDNNQLTWDDRMFELYGIPEAERGDRHDYEAWRGRVHPDDIVPTETMLKRLLDGDGKGDSKFRIVRGDGSVRYMQSEGIVERDRHGRPLKIVGINRDITEEKEAETRILELNATLESQVMERTAELRRAMQTADQANQAKSEFLANMSHEIRTPMNAILGLCYLLEKQDLNGVARDMVQKIHGSGRTLLGIINDILDFSKIEANRLAIEEVPFRLSDVLDNLASIMSSAVGDKPIEVVVAPVPSGSDFLKGDALRLGQVLINLAGNAIKFTEMGEVVVNTELQALDEERARLRFSVRDTGIGIPPDKLGVIFNAFAQANTSVTRSYGGTGLGLSISRRLVELMGGELRVASESGKGSEFSFEIGFELCDPKESAIPEMLYQRILIADDQATARGALAETASCLGWRVDTATSGTEALELAGKHADDPYDILLLDWRMPGMDGLSAAQAIRRKHRDDTPIIIMVTAFDRERLLGEPGSDVVDVVVSKPVTSSSLYNALLEARNRRGELRGAKSRDPARRRLAGVNVLVVDDNEINREIAKSILDDEGAAVDLAEDGAAALTALECGPGHFDVVLMDVQMPVMDGYSATRRIRSSPSLAHLPVVALTAGAFKSERDAALEAGMDDFVAKPFNVDELVETVLRSIGREDGAGQGPADPTAEAGASAAAVEVGEERQAGVPAGAETGVRTTARTDVRSVVQPAEVLPVLDLDQGLKLWRDEDRYKQYLRIFASACVETPLGKDALDAELAAWAHKTKGSAGNLGLRELAQRCGEVERHLADGQDARSALEGVEHALRAALAAISAYAPPPAQDPASGGGIDGKKVAALLAGTLEALNHDDPGAVEPWIEQLNALIPHGRMAPLRTAVENFDFRGAEGIASGMARELNLVVEFEHD